MKTDPNTHKTIIKKGTGATGRKAKTLKALNAGGPQKKTCEDCRAFAAFHAWREQPLTPSFNWCIDFTAEVNIPAGKRAVIELVTATITVPAGEKARLRLFTSLGMAPSNLDLTLTPQGTVLGKDELVATHTIRAYSDELIEFNVNRDNAQTEGNAFICISGYIVDA